MGAADIEAEAEAAAARHETARRGVDVHDY